MKKWEVLEKLQKSPVKRKRHGAGKKPKLQGEEIVDILLKNRGIKTKSEKEEFFKPTRPFSMKLTTLGIDGVKIKKAIKRIVKAKTTGERVIVFGDYDADGVCATAILWECLYGLGLDALPYIPERFNEGYGLKEESVKSLSEKYKGLRLIITVDNGIVANEAVDAANKLGIDVIITDHHLKGKKLPKAHSIIHTTKIGGAGVSWILSREIKKKVKGQMLKVKSSDGLDLAAIGTIADQLPLIGPNRSFAKYGLEALNNTKRVGLLALLDEAGLKKGSAGWRIGTYEVNFVIAPRLNAMGRLEHAIDSLRLLCTKSRKKAVELSNILGSTNTKRQKIVEEVVEHARGVAEKRSWEGAIVLHHESYHEGVIGLAASRLVEQFYRPSIVIAKGRTYSKASARSISGFNIIEVLSKLDDMLVDGGGHPMAAGFTIKTSKLESFTEKLDEVSKPLLKDELLVKKLKVDLEINFGDINWMLFNDIRKFEPTGIGNPAPMFVTRKVAVLDTKVVGADRKHLKLTLGEDDKEFSAIAFGFGDLYTKLSSGKKVDIVFRLQENNWSGQNNLELIVKDIRISA